MSSIPSISIYELFEERLSQLQDWIRNYDGELKEGKSLWRELKSPEILDTRMTTTISANFEQEATGYGRFFHESLEKLYYVDSEFQDKWTDLFAKLCSDRTRMATSAGHKPFFARLITIRMQK